MLHEVFTTLTNLRYRPTALRLTFCVGSIKSPRKNEPGGKSMLLDQRRQQRLTHPLTAHWLHSFGHNVACTVALIQHRGDSGF